MEKLWAPWRMNYIQNCDRDDEGCIFCTKPLENTDKENLILYRGKNVFVIMNRYPYNNGHLMIVPYEHTPEICALNESQIVELWKTTGIAKDILSKTIQPHGFNVGINIGRTAGAGIDQHLHIHLVPRWNGDTNFMPVLAGTKVISQSLSDSYDTLIPLFTQISTST